MKDRRPPGPTRIQQRKSADSSRLSLETLAHELNSLLDGSMRCVRLAEQALNDAERPRRAPDSVDGVLERLQTARQAMNEMAALLGRALQPSAPGKSQILHSSRTLGGEVDRVLAGLTPMAEEAGVALRVDVDPAAAPLPAAALGHVLLNGLRNAIQACAAGGRTERKVDATIGLSADGAALHILITDTGDGVREAVIEGVSTRPGGYGLGLSVCREIVAELDGRLDLRNGAAGNGAVLDITVPARSLERP
jgi:signal transduction histidine kinase